MSKPESGDGSSRREFLAKAGRAAAASPAVALLLSSSVVPAAAGYHYGEPPSVKHHKKHAKIHRVKWTKQDILAKLKSLLKKFG